MAEALFSAGKNRGSNLCVWMQTKGCMSCCCCLRNMMLHLVLDSLPDQQ